MIKTLLDYRRTYIKDYEIVEFVRPLYRYDRVDDAVDKVFMLIYKR